MRVVAADLIEVVVLAGHTQALLRVDGARVGALVRAEEDILELHHAGVGEQQRCIPARDKRRGRHGRVAVLDEEVDESLANLGAAEEFHEGSGESGCGIIPMERGRLSEFEACVREGLWYLRGCVNQAPSEGGLRRAWTISPIIDRAISSGDSAPISKPIGAWSGAN